MREPARWLPVDTRAQVVVVGGGPAGLAAAVAARRAGAATLLVERYGFPGGLATSGLIGTLCGLFTMKAGEAAPIVAGLARELVERLTAAGGASPPLEVLGRTFVIPYDAVAFKCVADDLLHGAGVGLRLHTLAVGLLRDGDEITGVITESKSGRRIICGDIFIDATGDADLAAWAGCPTKMASRSQIQRPSLLFIMNNVDSDRAFSVSPRWLAEKMEEVAGREEFALPRFSGFYRPTPIEGQVRCNLTRIDRPRGVLGTKADDLTFAEVEGRRQVREYARFLVKYVPGFERASVSELAPQVGFRETRRIVGEYVLKASDFVKARKFSDGIACNAWPMEIHGAGARTEWVWLDEGQYHQVPFRCLLPKGAANLLVVGRSISATHEALAAVRAIALCMAEGEAAGVAAAMAVERDTSLRAIEIAALRRRLVEGGAYLGGS